ncbi:ATP11 protein-domain-containing protein [Dichotomopilus funicola]|uniref:ATP11 protein-domain-containing protein n=1 Tax=Dichotomopilus funicola TaxID=1934379 RepID=A0AAN6VBS4_9PEZI|nr:ATP11 protein-domain-containing protein [Dichotomopilus funicola]
MAALRPPALQHLLSHQTRVLRTTAWHQQRRWAQVHDARFLATTQQPRHILEKYRQKLDEKARAEGHADIDSLKAAYSDKIKALRKETDAVTAPLDQARAGGVKEPLTPPPSPGSSSQQPQQQPQPQHQATTTTSTTPQPPTPPKSPSSSPTGVKPLSAILNLPKVLPLPNTTLTNLWRQHHSTHPRSLCAVIPASTYQTMDSLARQHPHFVLPVPHPQQGAEIHFCQWTWDVETRSATVLFTQLAEYKVRGEFAVPHTTVTHYLDLVGGRRVVKDFVKDEGEGQQVQEGVEVEEEGVVLMQGMVVEDRGVKVEDAQWLVMCLQRFYGGWDGLGGQGGLERAEERRRLLEWFGKGDERFSVEKLLEQAERMG